MWLEAGTVYIRDNADIIYIGSLLLNLIGIIYVDGRRRQG
jgi:hypothetical protein